MARIVITGANSGIGLALATAFAARGDDVVAACRKTSPALSALKVDIHEGVDVTDDRAIAAFAETLADGSVDVLINNAAIYGAEALASPDFLDGVRAQFEVNAIGPLRVTRALLPKMHAGAKLVIITSRSGSIGDNGSGGYYGYRMSKAAVNMAGVNLAHDLKPQGIAVALLHPGMVRTGMTSAAGAISPAVSAERLIARIDEMTLAGTGRFLHAEGHELPW